MTMIRDARPSFEANRLEDRFVPFSMQTKPFYELTRSLGAVCSGAVKAFVNPGFIPEAIRYARGEKQPGVKDFEETVMWRLPEALSYLTTVGLAATYLVHNPSDWKSYIPLATNAAFGILGTSIEGTEPSDD